MKKNKSTLAPLLLYICIATACGSGNSGQQNSSSDQNGGTIEGEGDSETVAFVGKYAKWVQQTNREYDGNYDEVTGIFIVCNNTTGQRVSKDQVVLMTAGACDAEYSNRVRLMKFKVKSGLATTIANGPQINTSLGKQTVEWTTETGKKTMVLKESEMSRISEALKNEQQKQNKTEEMKAKPH